MVVKDFWKVKEGRFKLIVMSPNTRGDAKEEEYGTTDSVEEANAFLDGYEGRVDYNDDIVGFNWGEIVHVKLQKNGEPKIVD